MGMTNSSLAVVHYPLSVVHMVEENSLLAVVHYHLPVVHMALSDSPLAVVYYPWVRRKDSFDSQVHHHVLLPLDPWV